MEKPKICYKALHSDMSTTYGGLVMDVGKRYKSRDGKCQFTYCNELTKLIPHYNEIGDKYYKVAVKGKITKRDEDIYATDDIGILKEISEDEIAKILTSEYSKSKDSWDLLSKSVKIPKFLINIFARSKYSNIRYNIVKNPVTPLSTLKAMQNDKNESIRKIAKKRVLNK